MNSCPLCDGALHADFQVHGYSISVCAGCGHRTAIVAANRAEHVAATYGDDYFSGGAAGYEDYVGEGELLRQRGRAYGKLLKQHAQPGRMLDVGAAAGFILQGFHDEGWRGVGVEPNAKMAEFARTKNRVQVECGAFEDCRAPGPFDLVSIIQVMAHFVNPGAALRHTASLLGPGGLLLIETWDRQSVTARLFGKAWHEYSPPSVLQWFSKDGLREFASQQGFDLVASGRPYRSIQAGHAASLMKYKLNGSLAGKLAGPLLGLVPKGLTLPYPGDDLFWDLYRLRSR